MTNVTEKFTEDEAKRLDQILSIEINPYVDSGSDGLGLPLGGKTQEWLFETRVNLPPETRAELDKLDYENQPRATQVHLLNEILEERQWSSAPQWWELNFFEANIDELWKFFVDQCRNNFENDAVQQELFDFYVARLDDLNNARDVLRFSKYNKEKYSEEEINSALNVYDQSYPLDFEDYEEAPRKIRSPLDALQTLIAHELSNLDAVFSKRWFEFKILDELAAFTSYKYDAERDSELSKKMAAQMRYFFFGRILALGRMVEHYRWKFSHEESALKGIQTEEVNKVRGQKGGEASRKRRKTNLEAMMREIEKLAGAAGLISEERIVEQAMEAARERETNFPKSRKTLDDYGTALRSEEPFKSRYEAVFRKNA